MEEIIIAIMYMDQQFIVVNYSFSLYETLTWTKEATKLMSYEGTAAKLFSITMYNYRLQCSFLSYVNCDVYFPQSIKYWDIDHSDIN